MLYITLDKLKRILALHNLLFCFSITHLISKFIRLEHWNYQVKHFFGRLSVPDSYVRPESLERKTGKYDPLSQIPYMCHLRMNTFIRLVLA